MRRYLRLMREMDGWFASVLMKHSDQMQCGKGCALCCYGLFDISLADAVRVAEGFSALGPAIRAQVALRATPVHERILAEVPELESTFFLHVLGEDRIDQVVDRVQSLPCPLLGCQNECLIYEYRPLACRMEGVPMVDAHDGLFGDWCELNFVQGVPPEALADLSRDYYQMEEIERRTCERLSESLLAKRRSGLTVFIPSLIVEFEGFWKKLLRKRKAAGGARTRTCSPGKL